MLRLPANIYQLFSGTYQGCRTREGNAFRVLSDGWWVVVSSSVAQSVEQVAVNHPVGGSSPSRGASYQNGPFSSEKGPFLFGTLRFFSLKYRKVACSLGPACHPSKLSPPLHTTGWQSEVVQSCEEFHPAHSSRLIFFAHSSRSVSEKQFPRPPSRQPYF